MRLSIVVCFVAVAGIAIAETREAVPDRYYNTFSHTNPVFLRINQGDIVVTKTLDSGGMDDRGQSRATGGNPLTGPFYIDNAEPGDAILVHLRKVRLNRNWGSTAYRLAPFSVLPEFVESMYPNHYKPDIVRKGRDNILPWDLDLKTNTVKLREPASGKINLEFPARPMLAWIFAPNSQLTFWASSNGISRPAVVRPTRESAWSPDRSRLRATRDYGHAWAA